MRLAITTTLAATLSIASMATQSNAVFAADMVPLKTVVTEYMGDGLELAVTPQPQGARLGDRLLRVRQVKLVVPRDDWQPFIRAHAEDWVESVQGQQEDAPSKNAARPLVLCELGDGSKADKLLAALKISPTGEQRAKMGSQGYVLFVGETVEHSGGVVVVAGVGPEGTYFGLQSLKQLTLTKNDNIYIRTGTIVDWPSMPWRGSKRPAQWEDAYKANFGKVGQHPFRIHFGAGADPQRQPKSYEIAAGETKTRSRGLDVSDAYIDQLMAQWKASYERSNNPYFSLKGDDVELELDEKSGTRERFKGNVGAAYVHLLTQLNKRLKQIDPKCTLYWMPNPYYTTNWDFVPLSRQVREAGGLPSDVGLWWTGHYVFSPQLTEASIRGYQQAFYGDNPIKVKGLIYDNHGRANDYGGRADDFFAMPQRDPQIAELLMGISNERGSAINRITSYDFQWNPEDYDAERALKLAVRELTARDPAYYRTVMEFVSIWERGRYPTTAETTHKQVAQQQTKFVQQLGQLEGKIQAEGNRALATAGFTDAKRRGDFRSEFQAAMLRAIAMKREINADLDTLWRDANAPAYVIASTDAPKIDGQLDEAIYDRAATLAKFFTAGKALPDPKAADGEKKNLWEIPAGTIPDELSTHVWLLADESHLYIAARCRDRAYPLPNDQQPRRASARAIVGNDHPYNWRQPCLDINLDVHHDHENTFHLIVDPLGQVFDEYLGWPGDALPTGPPWTSGGNVKVVADGDGWTLEAAIPLEKLGLKSIPADTVWGANAYRIGLNVVSMHSQLNDTGPYGLRYPKVFGHVHWKRD